MEEADINNMLVQKLNYYYDSQVHSIVDLSMREVTGDKGSLCGMAALYQAARQTILTISQLKQMSFLDVKAQVGERLGYDLAGAKKQKDVNIINEFHSCKFLTKPTIELTIFVQCFASILSPGRKDLLFFPSREKPPV